MDTRVVATEGRGGLCSDVACRVAPKKNAVFWGPRRGTPRRYKDPPPPLDSPPPRVGLSKWSAGRVGTGPRAIPHPGAIRGATFAA